MRIKFWSEPIRLKIARTGWFLGGTFLTAWGVQTTISHFGHLHTDNIGLIPALAALSTGVTLLQGAVMADSGWIARLRHKVINKGLAGEDNEALTEENQIKAIKNALETAGERIPTGRR